MALRPLHRDQRQQMESGGTRVWLEFEADTQDLVQALYHGIEIVEDALAAIALSAAIPFGRCIPVQLLESVPGVATPRFLCMVLRQPGRWHTPIRSEDINFLGKAALHWHELDAGERLRRAARRYAQALGEPDSLLAFQLAYTGLEALEKPLAQEMGIPPGVEVVPGTCANCGAQYERKRTVLAGVRAFVRGELHGTPSQQREQEWKRLSDLRVDLVHSLVDPLSVEPRAIELLPAAMHHLHDASVHLAHAHDREQAGYRLPRLVPIRFLFSGTTPRIPSDPFLPILEVTSIGWAEHPEYHFVPELQVFNHAGTGVESAAFVLKAPLASATEGDLEPMVFDAPEDGEEGVVDSEDAN